MTRAIPPGTPAKRRAKEAPGEPLELAPGGARFPFIRVFGLQLPANRRLWGPRRPVPGVNHLIPGDYSFI